MPERCKCTTAQILLGKSYNNAAPSDCHTVHGVLSVIITIVFRISLLLLLLSSGNSIIIRLYPPHVVKDTEKCEDLTKVFTDDHFITYRRSEDNKSSYHRHPRNKNDSVDQQLFWFGESKEYFHNFYYYCGDLSGFLNTTWIPLLTWFIVNIFPSIFLSIITLLFTLRSRFVEACCTNPGIILAPVISHFHVGPISFSMIKSGYITCSISLTLINILLTFLALCFSSYLVFADIGPRPDDIIPDPW